jgi:hypothetical protein
MPFYILVHLIVCSILQIRLPDSQQQKTAQEDMKPEQLDKLMKLEGWPNDLPCILRYIALCKAFANLEALPKTVEPTHISGYQYPTQFSLQPPLNTLEAQQMGMHTLRIPSFLEVNPMPFRPQTSTHRSAHVPPASWGWPASHCLRWHQPPLGMASRPPHSPRGWLPPLFFY